MINREESVTEFVRFTAKANDIKALADKVVSIITKTLDVEYCNILEYVASSNRFLLKSGPGWRDGLVGNAIMNEWNNSQPNYTVRNRELVIAEDINSNACLDSFGMIVHHRIIDSTTTIINNAVTPFGVLSIYSIRLRKLSECDNDFLKTITDILAMAIRNIRSQNDISILKKIEKEKEDIEKQLIHAQRLGCVGLLAGGITHDFNNMLTAINGFASLAEIEISDSHKVSNYLGQIKHAVSLAESLTRQLLIFSRKQTTAFKPICVNTVIKNLEKIIGRLLGDDIQIEMDLEGKLMQINGDKGNIEQILINLSINARDAMLHGGRIIIKTEDVILDEDQCTKIKYSRPGRFVCISVTDTGQGIDDETIKYIFDPLFTTKSEGKGTGLGLSVVSGVVKDHKGWINVYSVPENGSTFKIYLPACSVEHGNNIRQKVIPVDLMGDRKRVLVIEDDEDLLIFNTAALAKYGYVVYGAKSIKDATAIFNRTKEDIDLVFSDVVLPDGDSIAMIEEFVARKQGLHVVMTSGYLDDKCGLDFIRKRGFKFIHKPYVLVDLLEALKNIDSHSLPDVDLK
ncbi:MAG: ATP-binding protein [Candidatus Anammoxibacter sp.]